MEKSASEFNNIIRNSFATLLFQGVVHVHSYSCKKPLDKRHRFFPKFLTKFSANFKIVLCNYTLLKF
ncbi:hypothetical protein CW304_12965 [Bacillus sp. UFRGS-B20]|nr:hypothetical protein CW304_12965 [Bacillus sp. UFRGS-B20]